MERTNRCSRCNLKMEDAKTGASVDWNNFSTGENRKIEFETDELQIADAVFDEAMLQTDPQSGDVTDGSVDYYDFDWGEMVVYPEETMEPKLPNCNGECGCGCFQSCGKDVCEEEPDVPCTGMSVCGNNQPRQQDETTYAIVSE